jgi:hypothetical protein
LEPLALGQNGDADERSRALIATGEARDAFYVVARRSLGIRDGYTSM